MEKAIVVKNLRKVYEGEVVAVDDVSFEVERGEIFGFLGPNGAGKTTTINILTTLVPPTSGEAYVGDHKVGEEDEEIRRIIGLVPQELTADDELTGWENIYLQGSLYGMSRSEIRSEARELLQMVGLEEAADRLVRTYSGGMRRRLELVMGLIHKPEILFLDEPTLGLDVQTRAHLWDHIRRVRSEYDMTIFMTTHYMDEADKLCDRIAIIDHGRIKAIGTPDELKRMVEGDLVIVRTVDGPPIEVSLDGIPGLKDYTIDGTEIRIRVEEGERATPAIIESLVSRGYRIRSVELVRPSLEQVFLTLTGRSIREEEALDTISYRVMMRRRRG